MSAKGVLRHEGFPYALDNGAWSAFQKSEPFDEAAFIAAVEQMGAGADWVVVPDVVEDAAETLRLADRWLPWVLDRAPMALLAVQDGMEPRHVAHMLCDRVGVALGGSTEWKERQLAQRVWRASWLHVLRVNTARRVHLCSIAGATSFDGSSVTRFAKTLPLLEGARRQGAFQW